MRASRFLSRIVVAIKLASEALRVFRNLACRRIYLPINIKTTAVNAKLQTLTSKASKDDGQSRFDISGIASISPSPWFHTHLPCSRASRASKLHALPDLRSSHDGQPSSNPEFVNEEPPQEPPHCRGARFQKGCQVSSFEYAAWPTFRADLRCE